jgi:hypothetical protein
MGCPGIHCPGCTEGQSLAITGGAVLGLLLAAETVKWVAERVWWIGGTMAVCLALSVAASMALEAWADRRGARFAAAHGILSRADVIRVDAVETCESLPHSRLAGRDRELVTPARPAIEPPPGDSSSLPRRARRAGRRDHPPGATRRVPSLRRRGIKAPQPEASGHASASLAHRARPPGI